MKIVYTHVPIFLTQPHFILDLMAYRFLSFANLIPSLSITEMLFGQTPLDALQMFHFEFFLPYIWIFKKFAEWPLLNIIIK